MEIDIKKILVQQLEKKGLASSHIPCFIRNMENTFLDDPTISFFQVNNQLNYLGWDDIQLDYHTFVLAREYLKDGLKKDRLS